MSKITTAQIKDILSDPLVVLGGGIKERDFIDSMIINFKRKNDYSTAEYEISYEVEQNIKRYLRRMMKMLKRGLYR